MPSAPFLPAWVYTSSGWAARERSDYASRCWHPLAAASALAPGQALATELIGLPLLLTRGHDGRARAFLNRCPHRGVALLARSGTAQACRRLICPYHGWTYSLAGELLAAAREAEFLEPFRRQHWPLQELPCQEFGSLLWVALQPGTLALEQQLDLVLQEAGELFALPRRLLAQHSQLLLCNWKIAHDNTLDDYHVAIAHPATLHREQGPVRDYQHVFSVHANLLATPHGRSGTFYTFGLAPWTHLLLWPDGRLALISFLPELPLSASLSQPVDRCTMQVWLLAPPTFTASGEEWMAELRRFLEEDRRLVESAQHGYATGLRPGPPHRLERRILQWQGLYAAWMELPAIEPPPPASSDSLAPPTAALD